MRFLMSEDGRMRCLPIFSRKDDIFHPAERVDIPLRYNDFTAILFPDQPPPADNPHDGKDGDGHPGQHKSHSRPEQEDEGCRPPGNGGLHQRYQFLSRYLRCHDSRFRNHGRHLYGLMDGNDAQRQQKREHSRSHQHHPVEPVERLLLQKETVEQVEHQQRKRNLSIIYEEFHHFCSPFSTRSMSSFSSSTVIFSSFTRADTALR